MMRPDPRPAATPAAGAARPSNAVPDEAKKPGSPAVPGGEFDFAIEEIAPTQTLKEGFTGQER